jgi:ubiquinone biosynthesis accessory factor UbiK
MFPVKGLWRIGRRTLALGNALPHHCRSTRGANARRWGGAARERLIQAGQRTEDTMLNSKTLDELAARIGKAFEASPAKDIEKNVKAMLQSGLSRLDLVTRQEFEIQVEVLRKTREKVERLETRIAELEARAAPPTPTQPLV